MSLMSDVEIKEALKAGEIDISPLEPKNLQPASYDLRVGRVLIAGKGIVDPERVPVILRTGEWAEIETLEIITLSPAIAANFGIRSSITRRGIDWFGGPQVDPGYSGKLYISMLNASNQTYRIEGHEPFCTIEFHHLGKPAETGYAGRYQGMRSFPEEDVERMIKMESRTLADVVDSVSVLEQTVKELRDGFKTLSADVKWVKIILLAIFAVMLAGMMAKLL